MNYVGIEEFNHLSVGAALLGSGGGGSTDYEVLMAEKHLMQYGQVRLVSVDELQKDDLVLPIAMVGAPLVGLEMLPSGRECECIIELVEKMMGRRPTHLMPAEIGGGNAFCPFLFAARLNLPVVDADTIGRAFPEIQMSSCNLFHIPLKAAFIADALGNSVIIHANDTTTLEEIVRKNVVAMGSSAMIGVYLMDGDVAKKSVVKGSISLAIEMGKSLHTAKNHGQDPIQALVFKHGASILGSGVIIDVIQSIEEGFLKGSVTVLTQEGTLAIAYQNEYLEVKKNGTPVSVTPEIICILDCESALPINSEKLLFGLRVTVIALPSPDIWMTPAGLKLVGPNYFGYEPVTKICHV